MLIYKRILLGIELHPLHDAYTTQRAIALANKIDATLYAIHAYEGINEFAAKALDLKNVAVVESKIVENAKKSLDELEGQYGIFAEQLFIEKGSPKTVIVETAEKLNADLIVLGGGTKRATGSLIGSTAQWVLQNAHCDVLTIYFRE